jgi:hypothetical protein
MYSLYKHENKIFKSTEATIKRGLSYKEMNKFGLYYVYIHRNITRNSLSSYLKHKCHFFFHL